MRLDNAHHNKHQLQVRNSFAKGTRLEAIYNRKARVTNSETRLCHFDVDLFMTPELLTKKSYRQRPWARRRRIPSHSAMIDEWNVEIGSEIANREDVQTFRLLNLLSGDQIRSTTTKTTKTWWPQRLEVPWIRKDIPSQLLNLVFRGIQLGMENSQMEDASATADFYDDDNGVMWWPEVELF